MPLHTRLHHDTVYGGGGRHTGNNIRGKTMFHPLRWWLILPVHSSVLQERRSDCVCLTLRTTGDRVTKHYIITLHFANRRKLALS